MRDIIGKRNWFFLLSGLIVIPGLIFIILTPLTGGSIGLKFSIDYTGGTLWEIKFKDASVTPSQVKTVLTEQNLGESTVTTTNGGYILIRTKPIGLQAAPTPTPTPSATSTATASASAAASGAASATPAPTATATPKATPSPSPTPTATPTPKPSASASASAAAAGASATPKPSATPIAIPVPTSGELGSLATALQAKLGPIESVRQLDTVGPVISNELTTQAILLVILGSIGIMAWLTFRFRDFKFGVAAIASLVHDVIVVVGIFAILGTIFGIEVDALFVTAMLTIIGFSVHDTIVVFDRIRENRARHSVEPFDSIVNHSILQTLGRSINTSFVVLLTLLALFLFTSGSIRTFVLVLLIGITSGTYSSIFNASPILVVWHNWEQRRGRGTKTTRRASV